MSNKKTRIESLSEAYRSQVRSNVSAFLDIDVGSYYANEISYPNMIEEFRWMALQDIDTLTEGFTVKYIGDDRYLVSVNSVEEIVRRLRIIFGTTHLPFCDFVFDAHVASTDGVELVGLDFDDDFNILQCRDFFTSRHRLAVRISSDD